MPTCTRCQTGYPEGTRRCPRDGAPLDGSGLDGSGLDGSELDEAPRTDDASPERGPSRASAVTPGSSPAERSLAPRGRAASEKTDPLLGTTLAGRYRLLRRLGEGGMGVVYEATHAVIGRSLAVKVLHERYVDRPEVAARLMNEARLASAIRNQHIVDIFDFGETSDGRTFVAMELCAGCSLAQTIRAVGPLDERRAGEIALQVSDALGAAHAAGILHRDVKPENIFLVPRDGGDFVKVLDFGISKAMRGFDPLGAGGGADAEALRLTHTGMVLGTPFYMSPEQARGDDNIDHRIDIYALGVILYEALTGEVPFSGTNYLSIISEVQHREVVRPRELRPEVSPAMERVVLRAIHRDRDQRYPSMVALGEDLRRALDGESIEATATTTSPTGPRERDRTRRWVLGWAAGAGAMALLVGTATVWLAARAAPSSGRGELTVPSSRASRAAEPPAAVPTRGGLLVPQARAEPASSTVIVKIQSTPPGAAILNGSRKLGVTPQAVELARASAAVHLRFELDGYLPSATDIVPQIDGESVEIELKPVVSAPPERPPRPHRASRSQGQGQARNRQAAPEMLPAANPYR